MIIWIDLSVLPYRIKWYGTYMVQVWRWYGRSYGPYMFNKWIYYGLLPYISNQYGATVFHFCLSIVCCYGMATYFIKFHTFSIACGLGMVWVFPISVPYVPNPALWDCYVFRKVPHNSHSSWIWQHLLWECYGTSYSSPILQPQVPGITAKTMGNLWDRATHMIPI